MQYYTLSTLAAPLPHRSLIDSVTWRHCLSSLTTDRAIPALPHEHIHILSAYAWCDKGPGRKHSDFLPQRNACACRGTT